MKKPASVQVNQSVSLFVCEQNKVQIFSTPLLCKLMTTCTALLLISTTAGHPGKLTHSSFTIYTSNYMITHSMLQCKIPQADNTQDERFIACNKHCKTGMKMTDNVFKQKYYHYRKQLLGFLLGQSLNTSPTTNKTPSRPLFYMYHYELQTVIYF